uniref:Retrotrans_gag domain-containing protein n=1 Tax=Caenorhabditis japonica TaxID=281687 RepID=A0A8R1E5N9_CAEJA
MPNLPNGGPTRTLKMVPSDRVLRGQSRRIGERLTPVARSRSTTPTAQSKQHTSTSAAKAEKKARATTLITDFIRKHLGTPAKEPESSPGTSTYSTPTAQGNQRRPDTPLQLAHQSPDPSDTLTPIAPSEVNETIIKMSDNETKNKKKIRRIMFSSDSDSSISEEETTRVEQKTGINGKSAWKDTGDLLRLLEKRIKPFKSGKAADVCSWLNSVSRIFGLLDVPAKEGVALLPFFLVSPAAEKYESIPENKKTSWKRVTKAFVKLHACEVDKEVSIQEISNLQQGKKSISEFAEEIKKLGRYAYDNLPEESREWLMATQFMNGVNKQIRSELRRLPRIPKTLSEMAAEAGKFERLLNIEAEEDEEDTVIAALHQTFPNYQQGRGGHFGPRGRRQYGRQNYRQNQEYIEQPAPSGLYNRNFHQRPGYGYMQQHGYQGFQGGNLNQRPGGQMMLENGPAGVTFNNRTGRPRINSLTKFLLTMVALSILPAISPFQICGFGLTGNMFIPPKPIDCEFNTHIYLFIYLYTPIA